MTEKNYKLDWETTDIRLAKGRFTHTLRRPTTDEILAREKDLQVEVPISKVGGYALPDPTAEEETDAKYHDLIVQEMSGYPDGATVPDRYKAAAFQDLYRREADVDENATAFDEEITVIEEIGSGDEPDFVIRHIFRQPTEEELRKFHRRMNTGELLPDKRGRLKFVTRTNLRAAMEFYRLWAVRIEGIETLGEGVDFRDVVDPLVQRSVVKAFAAFVSNALSD